MPVMKLASIAILAVVGWSVYVTYREASAARHDRHVIAMFVRSDAQIRQAEGIDAANAASYWRGLAIHSATCRSACVSEKLAAFLASSAKLRERAAGRDRRAAAFWAAIAHEVDSRVAAGP